MTLTPFRLAMLALSTLYCLSTTPVVAAEFLGEEGEASDQDEKEAPKPAKKSQKSQKSKRAAEIDDEDEGSSGGGAGGGDISVSGGLGAGTGYIAGQITVGYGFNKWVSIDTTMSYYKFSTSKAVGETYGPEVDLVLRLANPTIVTPFVGAGPGYEIWKREYEGEIFDDRKAVTTNAFVGISVMLTRHFGIQVVRKYTSYGPTKPPISFSDRETPEPQSTIETTAGFHVSF